MKITPIFFLMSLAIVATGQKFGQSKVDSLLSLLTRADENAAKVDLYVNLMSTYNSFNGRVGLKYEQPALALAEKLHLPKSIGDIKNVVGRIYWREGKFDLALGYHYEAKAIFEREQDESKVALTTRYIGQDYADGSNYAQALKAFQQALALYTKLGNLKSMAHVHELIAWVYRKQGNYLSAAKEGYEMIRLFEKEGDKVTIAAGYSEIAENYIYLGNYAEALRFFEKSGEAFAAMNDRINVAYNYNLIGKAYQLMGNYPEAKKNYVAALALGKDVNDMNVIGNAYAGLAEVAKMINDEAEALKNYQAAAELFLKWSNRIDLARIYCKIAESYLVTKEYGQAKKYFSEALVIANELDSKALEEEYFKGVEKLDSTLGNWKDAYVHHKKYTHIKDSIFNQENIRQMVQIQLNYEFDKKEAAAKAAQEEKDAQRRKQFISLSAITILVFLLAAVFFRNQKRVAKINQELKLKSESLEEENREKASILNIVSHDLRAPFNKIKGLADLMLNTKDLTQAEKEEYISYIQTSVEQGNHLIGNLLDSQRMGRETNTPSFQEIDVDKFILDFKKATNSQLLKKQQQLKVSNDSNYPHLITDPQMLMRVLDNLVSNASKFSEKGKNIYLHVWSKNSHLNFSIRDEGPGISEEDQKKMFRKFQMLTARPTAGEVSTGLGLSITKALVEKLNGTIEVKSKLGAGTEIIVSFA